MALPSWLRRLFGLADNTLPETSPPETDRVSDLLEKLASDDDYPGNRGAHARQLGELGDRRAVGPLIAALKDENHYTRYRVAQALGRLGDARAVEPLIELLQSNEADPAQWMGQAGRPGAAFALGRLGDGRAVGPLIQALQDPSHHMRAAAAEALGLLGDPAAIPALLDVLDAESLTISIPSPHLEAGDALKRLATSPLAVSYLVAALKDPRYHVSSTVDWLLRPLKDPTAQAALAEYHEARKGE